MLEFARNAYHSQICSYMLVLIVPLFPSPPSYNCLGFIPVRRLVPWKSFFGSCNLTVYTIDAKLYIDMTGS